MKIIILALRRSGSTIFWECFRQATDAFCFDEPFNPKLLQLPKEHSKKTYQEFIDLLSKEQELFWQSFDPIYPYNELSSFLTDIQSGYLRKLFSQSQDVVIDTTRCWNKLPALKHCTDRHTYVIHLHRSPASWITSHLLPSDKNAKRNWRLNINRKRNFWSQTSDFNYWNLEDVVGKELLSPFHLLVLKDDTLAKKFYDSTVVYKLLKFWSIVFSKVETQGQSLFGDRFISIRFEDFCADPIQALENISSQTGLKFDYNRLPMVMQSRPAFMSNHINWTLAARYWNLPETLDFLHRNSELNG